MGELADSIEKLTNGVIRIVEERDRLYSRNRMLWLALHEVEGLLADKVDVLDGPDGEPRPNEWMRMLNVVREALYGKGVVK